MIMVFYEMPAINEKSRKSPKGNPGSIAYLEENMIEIL